MEVSASESASPNGHMEDNVQREIIRIGRDRDRMSVSGRDGDRVFISLWQRRRQVMH